ncbi:glycosyltransferase [Sphingobacterium sp. 2149]|uniref:glycosyltransferase n=1 Tax=Sphingobacterium sp. 2149 TaxID=2817763 RepID=UPI002862A683|nr:hypothetical protein [Sphingobacterium sp. 2149]MDR6733853.1 glycosyltransferase involved in cell wall biosynthesis [Sphingobacterium sp. 2149]
MKFYIKHFRGVVSEGGAVRNDAFYKHFRLLPNVRIMNIASDNFLYRIVCTIKFVFYFAFRRNDQIYMHIAAIFVLFPTILFRLGMVGIIFKFIGQLSKRHTLHIEVNDLPFEQSRDLELPNFSYYRSLQEKLFKLENVGFDFASYGMRNYAIEKYHLKPHQGQVVLNGANQVMDFDPSVYTALLGRNSTKLKYVYVGTLNKGRQIEDLIRAFEKSPNELFLLGPGGEWINDTVQSLGMEHVRYLGAFSDMEALQISSLCDVGVIPYDESRFYYNICYPTKVSFYLAAGLPILSTRLEETQRVLKDKDVAWFLPMSSWKHMIIKLKKNDVRELKHNVLLHRPQFYWYSLLSKLKFN